MVFHSLGIALRRLPRDPKPEQKRQDHFVTLTGLLRHSSAGGRQADRPPRHPANQPTIFKSCKCLHHSHMGYFQQFSQLANPAGPPRRATPEFCDGLHVVLRSLGQVV